ncbi:MAG: hypothetical protein AAB518_03300 [Patescibacteria group bacterium]
MQIFQKKWVAVGITLGLFFVASVAIGWSNPVQNPPNEPPLLSVGSTGLFRDNIGIGTGSPLSTTTIAGNLSVGANFVNAVLGVNGAAIQGSLGIGTQSPISKVEIAGGGITLGNSLAFGSWNSRIPMQNLSYNIVQQGGRVVAMALGSDGLPIITYYTDSEFNFVKCHNVSCSVQTSFQIDDNANVGNSNPIIIGPDGYPIIGYDYVWQLQIGVKIVKCNDLTCNPATNSQTVTVDDKGFNPAIAVTPDNGLFIVYYHDTGSGGELVARHCSDLSCSQVLSSQVIVSGAVGNSPNLGSTISVSIGSDGFPVIGYHNAAGSIDDLQFVKCNDLDCISNSGPYTLNPSFGASGEANAMTIGQDGLPVIAVTGNQDAGNLKQPWVIKCGNATCSSYQATRLSPLENASKQAITISPDGFPAVAYFEGTNLKFVKCFSDDCSAYTATTVAQSANVAGGISLTIGADGLPLLGYKSNELILISCGNPLCKNYWTRR